MRSGPRRSLVRLATAFMSSTASSTTPPPPRVLSIQSHVVHGAVGNRAATLPLQLLGVETDVLNTVQYSNHVGYGSFAGEKLTGEQVWQLLQGMHANGLLSPTRLLTGYMGSVEAVRAAVRALPLLQQNNSGFQFWCDPVLGDNGRLYVPPTLVDAYRDEVMPFAHALLPNQFEAELLSGVPIKTESDARRACDAIHRRGVNLVIITSAEFEQPAGGGGGGSAASAQGGKPPLTVFLSRRPHGSLWRRVYRLDVPQLPAHFAGTGDLLAALLLGWDSQQPQVPVHTALRRALSGVQAVLKRTMSEGGTAPRKTGANEGYGSGTRPLGLRLLSSIDEIRKPDESIVDAPIRLDAPLQGILFDMDGTLTLPHQLDFDEMRRAAGLPEGAPIFAGIEALPEEGRSAAWAAIEAIELKLFETIKLQPGLSELIGTLKAKGVKMGIATRNNPRAVAELCRVAGLAPDTFDPVLTREGPYPDKPDPAIALAATEAWGLKPEDCLMVGDSMDDMRCGRAAGMATCFIKPAEEAGGGGGGLEVEVEPAALVAPVPLDEEVDFRVGALAELEALVADAVLVD